MIPNHKWVFQAKVVRVIDGDTLELTIDMGMHCSRVERVRLLGIDTPEVKGATKLAGVAASLWARAWLDQATGDWPLIVETAKDPDAFGRYLAYIWRIVDGRSLNDDLVLSGNAVVYRR